MYARGSPAPDRPDRESTIATGFAGPDLNSRPCPHLTEAASASVSPPCGYTCREVGCRGPDCGPAFSSQASQALMRRGTRLQAQISLPARLPGQAHRPRYPEGPAAPRTRLTPPPRAGRSRDRVRAFPGRWARTPSGNIHGPRSVPTGPFGPTTATSPRGHEHRAWYPRAWSR